MTTRSKKKLDETTVVSPPFKKRVESSWILLAKDSLLSKSFGIITLPHPAHGKPTKYCLDEINKQIFEMVSFNEPHRSWFIGETVKSDGSIQILTQIHPLFLILPRLIEQCSTRAIPLEDLLSEKGFDKILEFVPSLDKIADLKGSPDMKAYKYNEAKTLDWLEERVLKLAKVLKEKNIHVTSGAVSATFVTSTINNEHIESEFYLKYAHGIVSEYLPSELVGALENRFNFKPELIESVGNKRKSEVENNDSNKKMKNDKSDDNQENIFTSPERIANDVKKEKPLTAKEKARQKAASGTKMISSFFSKI